ncbi:SCO family protein [Pseudalkalibacillus sp. R45]|uniref:SCO family protein n=1 Tax=Pseudalkalibacillus sp. R45 TaxID=3457433 RepID=UPI003FCE30A8
MIRKKPHTIIASVLVMLFGFTLFHIGTDGFTAYTAETARASQLIEEKPEFPDVMFEDSEGRTYSISEFEDKYVFMTFIYTSCTSVCYILERNMAQVYDLLPRESIGKDIVFLSVSFDPSKDDPATLNKYKDYFNSDGETWRMARIPDQAQLDALLERFGVIVIPDGNGNYSHNSAFYLVDKQRRLVDVMDFTKVDEAADTIVTILEKEEGE